MPAAPRFNPSVLVALAAAGASLTAAPVGLAQTQARQLDPDQFPPSELFRELQLDAMACGRDNLAAPCDKTRQLADPLLDHPKLSAACKDILWNITERAVVVPANSYARREGLNRESTDLLRLCKPATKPLGSGAETSKEQKGGGGIGGFLRGLGIGGGAANP